MNIDEVILFLPNELKYDAYFSSIIDLIRDKIKDKNTKFIKIELPDFLYKNSENNDICSLALDDKIFHFMFVLDNKIYSFGVKKQGLGFQVYYEIEDNCKTSRTILVKTSAMEIVETKETKKVDGTYEYYDVNVYYYDRDYNELDIDSEFIKNQMFSAEFGIDVSEAEYYRSNFYQYRDYLSKQATRSKMKIMNDRRNPNDYVYFRSPFSCNLKEFFKNEYAKLKEMVLKKYLDKDRGIQELRFINRLDRILLWFNEMVGSYDELIISDSIFQDFIPVLDGREADAIDTRGIIIKKFQQDFTLYYVHFTDKGIDYEVQNINKEMLEEIIKQNSLNSNVLGLDSFVNGTRGR